MCPDGRSVAKRQYRDCVCRLQQVGGHAVAAILVRHDQYRLRQIICRRVQADVSAQPEDTTQSLQRRSEQGRPCWIGQTDLQSGHSALDFCQGRIVSVQHHQGADTVAKRERLRLHRLSADECRVFARLRQLDTR